MSGWTEESRKLAGIRLQQRMHQKSPEEISAIRKKAAATRRKNQEAKELGLAPDTPKKQKAVGINLDELAQQMGFGSATEALLEMAVRRAGFASVRDAAMWAVKEKTSAKTDVIAATVGKWESFDD